MGLPKQMTRFLIPGGITPEFFTGGHRDKRRKEKAFRHQNFLKNKQRAQTQSTPTALGGNGGFEQ